MADPQAGRLSVWKLRRACSRAHPGGLSGADAILITALLVVPACDLGAGDLDGSQRVPVTRPRTERGPVVGLVGTMTGPGAWRGDDAFEGADLGVNVLNRSLPPEREPYELITLDDHGDPATALALVERLAADSAIVGVVYAGPSEVLPRAEEALADGGVPAILCFGDLPAGAHQGSGSHLFQVSPPIRWQARRLAAYILDDRAYRTTGLLTERSPSGRAARRALQEALTGAGGRRARWVAIREGASNLMEVLSRLRRGGVEALVVGGGQRMVERLEGALRRAGELYHSTDAARTRSRSGEKRPSQWRPQVMLFDLGLAPGIGLRAGTVAAESLARGAHYLPVPGFRRWRSAFVDWWDAGPYGWELRAYQAVGMIGWAALRSRPEDDLATSLEAARSVRFGGMTVSFGPRDHLAVEPGSVGLWTIPRLGIQVPERERLPGVMPWVPLARTFGRDAGALFAPGEARRLWERHADGSLHLRFGVGTPRSDPVH